MTALEANIKSKNIHKNHLAYYLPALIREHATLAVVVTADSITREKLSHELAFFSTSETPVLHFPDWETLPYDHFSPHQDIISERLKTLSVLPQLSQGILLVNIYTLMQRVAPENFIQTQAFYLKTGQLIDLTVIKKRLVQAGYQLVTQVTTPGELAVRGSLFDIFPMGSVSPYRIDLWDNKIDSIRLFDVQTQRTFEKITAIQLLPAREFPVDQPALHLFRQQWREAFGGKAMGCPVYEAISNGQLLPGIEYYFPLFFEKTATLWDYLPKNTLFFSVGKLHENSEKYWNEIKSRYESLRHDSIRPLLPPEKLFLNTTEVFTALKNFTVIPVNNINNANININISIHHQLPNPFVGLKQYIADTSARILCCTDSAGRREALLALLRKGDVTACATDNWHTFLQGQEKLSVTVAPIEDILFIEEINIVLIPENILLGHQQVLQPRYRQKTSPHVRLQHSPDTLENSIKNLTELAIGAPIVHIEHGIGRYQGLQVLSMDNQDNEFLVIEYAKQAKLYVPTANLHLISRYSGIDPERAPLHTLGTEQWEKAKKKAIEQIDDIAAELLNVHAKRKIRPGIVHAIDTQYALFAKSFPFEETPDQTQVIQDVIQDMQSEKSMDRLVCGDVGFGKTEIAMRATFIAIQNGYQVAVLVPTTLLAQQHYNTFADRFADWAVKIDVLSRFRTSEEQKKTLISLKNGQTDIVIGTHKLIQNNILFKKLGLLIIDEEHRFGVRQKEKLKALRAEVDILTLTATPIPRTLNLSLTGMRDLSIISTPPAKRLSIKTFVHPYNAALIRESVLREILRGGQVYYLHNDVDTIMNAAQQLAILIPEAKIQIAHGQMRERELEKVMQDFYHQHFNVLLCTTIIETGIDIPSANTIIIDRADKLGLAQLHQLRGRVGRSHHQAYAYLLTPAHQKISPDAEKRLQAIAKLENLGAGFALASNDLEIRGAGEILGENQSGNIQEIGFNLYMDLLDRAVTFLKQGEKNEKSERVDLAKAISPPSTDINLHIPALIPDNYIPDVHLRLVLYKRLSQATTQVAIQDLHAELVDRFGALPVPVKNLLSVTSLKLQAQALGVVKIQASTQAIFFEFHDQLPSVSSAQIIRLIQQFPTQYQLNGQNKLKMLYQKALSAQEKIDNIQLFFEKIVSVS